MTFAIVSRSGPGILRSPYKTVENSPSATYDLARQETTVLIRAMEAFSGDAICDFVIRLIQVGARIEKDHRKASVHQ